MQYSRRGGWGAPRPKLSIVPCTWGYLSGKITRIKDNSKFWGGCPLVKNGTPWRAQMVTGGRSMLKAAGDIGE